MKNLDTTPAAYGWLVGEFSYSGPAAVGCHPSSPPESVRGRQGPASHGSDGSAPPVWTALSDRQGDLPEHAVATT
jgi:hypothetical protein